MPSGTALLLTVGTMGSKFGGIFIINSSQILTKKRLELTNNPYFKIWYCLRRENAFIWPD